MTLVHLPFLRVGEALRRASDFLNKAGVPSSRLEAEVLLAHALNVERIELYKSPQRRLSTEEASRYEAAVRRRGDGEPTAYIRGWKDFFSLKFRVGPGALIPRADSEIVVEEGMTLFSSEARLAILDLGTGSGALVIALLRHYRNATGVATDISEAALGFAAANARDLHVEPRLTLVKGNLFHAVSPGSRFDLIISNPPYIPTGEISADLRFEPREALDGGVDGLKYYREIVGEAWRFMNPGGFLLLEIGSAQKTILERDSRIISPHYAPPRFKPDLSGKDRVVVFPYAGEEGFDKNH